MRFKTFILFSLVVFSFFKIKAQYIKLHDFNYLNSYENGMTPSCSLVSDGTYLYGTAGSNGTYFQGIIYRILPDGTNFEKLHDFNETATTTIGPSSLFYQDGVLYGMTNRGGTFDKGIIFRIDTSGTNYAKLLDFNYTNGAKPSGSFVSDGVYLYGLTMFGGAGTKGTLFKIKMDGTNHTILFDFNNATDNIRFPNGDLVFDGTYFYGMTYYGGTNDTGVVFKVLPDGTGFIKLYDFNVIDGTIPVGSLVTDGSYLYGARHKGGVYNMGTIFKIKTDGTNFSKLLDFAGLNGSFPLGAPLLNGNYLYGMTRAGGVLGIEGGTVFKIKLDGTNYTQILSFDHFTQGSAPEAALVSDGVYLYGTTASGGSAPINQAGGTIFKLALYTGLQEKSKSNNSIIISPNPTNSNLSISSSVDYSSIKIMNSIGQMVASFEDKPTIVSVSDLSNGIYFIQLFDKKGNLLKTEKFIKE